MRHFLLRSACLTPALVCAGAVLSLLLAAHGACPADEFTVAFSPALRSAWAEQRLYDAWHRNQPTVSALGFEALVGDWPRLLQRAFFDVHNARSGNREVYPYAGYLDLGQVRTAAGAAKPSLAQATWCCRRYAVGEGRAKLEFYLSRLTPAVLFVTQGQTLELFAGKKLRGTGTLAPRGAVNKQALPTIPRWVACCLGGRVVVARTSEPLPAGELSEPWLLFWFGKPAPFFRTRVANVLWRTRRLTEYMRGEYFMPADMPVLVVLQRRPRAISATADALRFEFGERGAGAVAVVPVLGFYHPLEAQTAAWRSGLPAELVARCRAWARRLKYFPLSCTASFRASADGAQVTVRHRFTFLALPDDWQTEGEKLAPLPPVLALAARYGFPVRLFGELAPHPIMTHSGPYSGVVGGEAVEFSIAGLDRYISEYPAPGDLAGEGAALLRDELREEIRKTISAGHLAPAMSLGRKHVSRMEMHFANPGETLLAIAEALPYLDEQTQQQAVAYALSEAQRLDPLAVQEVPCFEGARREYFTPLSPDQQRELMRPLERMVTRTTERISAEQRANNAYPLWALAQASGRLDIVRERWEKVKEVALWALRCADWATCGYFRQGNEDRTSTRAANGQFARWLALARLGAALGDEQTAKLAAYMLARTALFRFAQGKVVRYMYDEKLQTIEAAPHWMARLSTSVGESGPALLWTDHWTGAEDDVRQVIRWDEFGPVVAQMFGDHWDPILPPFQELVPECGRFLGDFLLEESARYVAAVERVAPFWYLTRRQASFGKEISTDSPRNSFSIFLAKCYVLGADGGELLRYQDIPFTRVGDLYHIRRLVANVRCMGGLKWQRLGQR